MANEFIEKLIRQTANRFGIDVKRHNPSATSAGRLSQMLATQKVGLVIDVGANIGQFARSLRQSGYANKIVSFEPLHAAHAALLRQSKLDQAWMIAPAMAIGDHDGEVTINISENSVSSSLLDMLDAHAKAAPTSAYVAVQKTPVARLDSVLGEYLQPGTVSFLKIDTQGYEDRVLAGATELLKHVRGLQLELSFVPLYEGQKLFDELVEKLRMLGFSIWAIWPGFADPSSGRMLQVDVTFFRTA
ncbi:FkbM family methyltransferase [Dyella kyungheensis]|uniref:FkbM family methyltransferase n=1 Tax=Dyella kyungheensis TaxID=1242174 RepID=UPI003CFB35A3